MLMIVPSKKPQVSFLADPEVKRELEKWAAEERRTVSSLLSLIVEDALERRRESKKRVK